MGGREPLAKPQGDSHLKNGHQVFGLPITAILDEDRPVVSPLFEGPHRFSLQELRGCATSHPRDVITMPFGGQKFTGNGNSMGFSSQDFGWE